MEKANYYILIFFFLLSFLFLSPHLTGNSVLSLSGNVVDILGAGLFLLGVVSLGIALFRHKKIKKLNEI